MTVAELTVQLAQEAGVDPRLIAEALRKHPSTAPIADQVLKAAGSSSTSASSTALARTSPSSPATITRSASGKGGGGGGSGTAGGLVEWAQEPILWLPLPGKNRASVGISPMMLFLAYLAWRQWGPSGDGK